LILRVQDDRKRDLLFGAAPKRVVSLVPSETYNVAAIGCGGSLVGRTDYCELPRDLCGALPSVGGPKNPRLEAIVTLEPDLVLANQEENTKSDLEALAQRGLKVFVAFPRRVADAVAHLARLARIFRVDRHPTARTLIKQGYEMVRDAEDARAAARPPKTFCPIWMEPLVTIRGDTFISDVLDLAGAANVFARRERNLSVACDRDDRYPRVTMEQIVAAAPELVLLPSEPHAFTEQDADVFRKAPIPAAKHGAIVHVDGKDLCWYGARTIEGFSRVRAVIDAHRARIKA